LILHNAKAWLMLILDVLSATRSLFTFIGTERDTIPVSRVWFVDLFDLTWYANI
jgi:hypothetical protein